MPGGQDIRIDGLFRQETWRAVCSLQRSRGLDVDGIAGPLIWAALPPDAQMPLLRPGSEGDPVAALQRVLTEQAPGRWDVSPQAVTSLEAAVGLEHATSPRAPEPEA